MGSLKGTSSFLDGSSLPQRFIAPASIAVAVLVSAGWLAGEAAGQETPRDIGFTERISVHQVDLPVVVTRGGEPVTDLRPEDFAVTEDGEPRAIAYFDRWVDGRLVESRGVGGGASGETGKALGRDRAARDVSSVRHVLLAFDDSIGSLPLLDRALDDVRAWIRREASADTRWAVLTAGASPQLLSPFTSDPAEALSALEDLKRIYRGDPVRFAFDPALIAQRDEADGPIDDPSTLDPDWESDLERMISDASTRRRVDHEVRSALALRQVLLALSEVQGTKAMVLFYGGTRFFERGGSKLSSNRATLWGRYLRFWNDTADVAATAGFRVYATDVRGLNLPRSPLRKGVGRAVRDGLPAEEVSRSVAGILALRTGGRRLEINDYAEVLRRSQRELESYYLLGVSVPHGHDGRRHRWEVQVKREGVRVRHPEAYVDLSARDRLLAQLRAPATLPKSGGRLPVDLSVRSLSRSPERDLVVELRAGVRAADLGVVGGADGLERGEVEVFVARYSTRGTLLGLSVEREPFALSAKAHASPATGLTVDRRVVLPSAGGVVAVGFYDPVDHGTALTAVRVEPPDGG